MKGLTIGRIVWVRQRSGEDRPAMIVRVIDAEGRIGLNVFHAASDPPGIEMHEETGEFGVFDFDPEPKVGFWRWPERVD